VKSDVARLAEYQVLRIYDTDCDQAVNVFAALAPHQRLILGVFTIATVADRVPKLATIFGARADRPSQWDRVAAVTIGNESVMKGEASPEQVIAAVQQAKSLLAQYGYTGPVATVDAQHIVRQFPILCHGSDFTAANIHPFFNPNVHPSQAGPWVANEVALLKNSCGLDKEVVVTEAGWPHGGPSNGVATASYDSQAIAMASFKQALVNTSYVQFTAFNDLWKGAGVEQNFGILGMASA
jgi:exo-beta-1,3-glucanase (GH17 family)